MATLKRTFTNRGKRALELSELKPNGVYAVRHILPVEVAAERGCTQEQWGIVVLSASCTIRRSWNVEVQDGWHVGLTAMDGLELWKSSVKERQFAVAEEARESLEVKCQSMIGMISVRDQRITYFEQNRWHRVASWLDKFFSY